MFLLACSALLWLSSEPGLGIFPENPLCALEMMVMVWPQGDALGAQSRPSSSDNSLVLFFLTVGTLPTFKFSYKAFANCSSVLPSTLIKTTLTWQILSAK